MVRCVVVAATVAAFSLVSAPTAPAVTAAPVHAPCTIWSASSGGCYYPNCTAAHKAGEGDIPVDSPHYCPKQDRDDDGYACEW